MILLPDHKAVYVSTIRCGSLTMYETLLKHYGGVHYRKDGWHGRETPAECKDWLHFVTTRNPYSRLVSIWRAAQCDPISKQFRIFKQAHCCRSEEFVEFARVIAKAGGRRNKTPFFMPQYIWLRDVSWTIALRLETLDEEVSKLPFWRHGTPLQHAGNGTGDWGLPWTAYYEQPQAVSLAQRWANLDFPLFGYSRDNYVT